MVCCVSMVQAEDIVVLRTGKIVRGKIVQYKNGSLSIQNNEGKVLKGSIANVKEIQFDKPAGSKISTETPKAFEGAKGRYHLFILSGQSNMVGVNPATSFTPTVAAEFGEDNVIVVKAAWKSQPISKWYKKWAPSPNAAPKEGNGALYDHLMEKVNSEIKGKTLRTITLIWMQGEQDAAGYGNVYKASLEGLIEQFRTDMKRQDLNFVIGRLSDFSHKKYPHWQMVREVQVEIAEADKRGAWIDTDDLNARTVSHGGKTFEVNDLHYNGEGYKTLGKRFAEKAITLIKKK